MPIRNGNIGTDRTTTKAASVRKQLGTKNSKARVTRADRRRMVELREETGVQRSLTDRLVMSRLQWAGYVERLADDRLPKIAAELREQGRRRRGRPRLRWEDCIKIDVKKAWEEEDWKEKTRDRWVGKDYQMRRWRSCGQHLTPDNAKMRKTIYYVNRQEFVEFRNTKSSILQISTGVPQGSIWWPRQTKIIPLHSPKQKINAELAKIDEWLKINKLSLKLKKSKYMFKKKTSTTNINLTLKMYQVVIDSVDYFNFRGSFVWCARVLESSFRNN